MPLEAGRGLDEQKILINLSYTYLLMRIILDTNFLMLPIQFKIDIFAEIEMLVEGKYELCIMEGTIKELETLSGSKGKDSVPAKLALELIERRGIKTLKAKKSHVDDAILEVAGKNTAVATNDRKLIKKLKDKNIKVVYLRSKNRLEMR
jgi:rRNA-processing protein FCF1